MRVVTFPFEKLPSKIFGTLYRPVAIVDFWSRRLKEWREVVAIVDTGADYTLLPKFYADDLGINLKEESHPYFTKGFGGEEKIFLCPRVKVAFLGKRFTIPVGFLNRDDIPPLLGRHRFLESFQVTFHRHKTRFEK